MASANLDFSGLSVTRTFTFPDATGTIALTTGSASIVTVGTITTGVWHGTKIGLLYGGTNADLSGTGNPHNVLQQSSAGAAITVGQLAIADLSDAATITALATGNPGFGPISSGDNILINPTGPITIESLKPDTPPLATLTIRLGDGTKGQTAFLSSNGAVTALTCGGTNFTTQGLALPTAWAANQCFGFVWDDSTDGGTLGWMRFQ